MRSSPSGDATAFAGWRIVIVASLLGGLTGPGQSIGVSVFRGPMAESLDITDTALATAYLIGTLIGSAALPVIGRRIDSVGARRATVAIGIGFGLALAHMSLVGNVAWLALGFIGIRMLGQGALSMASVVSVTHWFDRGRGKALGITLMATSALMALVPYASTQLIEAWGWRSAWLLLGAAISLLVVPLGWFGLIDRPSDVGQEPDGPRVRASPRRVAAAAVDLTRAEAIRTSEFIVLAAAIATIAMLATGLLFHQLNILGEAGFSASAAAALFVPNAVGSIAGGLAAGFLVDTRVRSWLPAASMLLLVASLWMAGTVTSTLSAGLYAVMLGLAAGVGFTASEALLPAMFGTAHIGAIQGAFRFIGVVASSVGAVVFSVGADVAGSYQTASRWLAILPIGMGAVAAWVRPGR